MLLIYIIVESDLCIATSDLFAIVSTCHYTILHHVTSITSPDLQCYICRWLLSTAASDTWWTRGGEEHVANDTRPALSSAIDPRRGAESSARCDSRWSASWEHRKGLCIPKDCHQDLYIHGDRGGVVKYKFSLFFFLGGGGGFERNCTLTASPIFTFCFKDGLKRFIFPD